MMLKRLIAVVLLICTLAILAPTTFAVEEDTAINISGTTMITSNGYSDTRFLTDGDTDTFYVAREHCSITLMNENGIGSVYLIFDQPCESYVVQNAANGDHFVAGTDQFLHDYINLNEAFRSTITSVTFFFDQSEVHLSEIEIYAEGSVPPHVQIWQPPLENSTDLLLLSTHGDDDQLYFAGLIPTYTSMEGVGVQVAYLTDHRDTNRQRAHEMLNGLWASGCKVYPVMGQFPDFRIDDLQQTYKEYQNRGYSEEQLLGYVVGLLRRFKPQVVVGHDIDGEYGHGMHQVYTDCLIKALEISADETQFPELAEAYGLWDVSKVYLHLYKENAIELDYDSPLEAFNGMTAFEVSQKLGFPCHVSQQNTGFTKWINGANNEITKASQIKRYNPRYFGLFYSTVGEDIKKNDFLENITLYQNQAPSQQDPTQPTPTDPEDLPPSEEDLARLEEQRKELERIEAEKEEQRRLEKERLEQEALKKQQLQQEQEQQQQKKSIIIFISICAGVILVIVVYYLLRRRAFIRQMED